MRFVDRRGVQRLAVVRGEHRALGHGLVQRGLAHDGRMGHLAAKDGQRYVALPFAAGGGTLSVREPSSSAEAPPGWYMLFLIDDAGVTSVSTWVHVS
jgi:galactose oxidase-like protein